MAKKAKATGTTGKECPGCGIIQGRGKQHKDGCSKKKSSTASNSTPTPGGSKIDGRTSIPNLLKWQAEIEEQLASRDKADVRRVKKAIEEVEGLREKLAEAEKLAGL